MTDTDWIQAIAAFVVAIATVVIAWYTGVVKNASERSEEKRSTARLTELVALTEMLLDGIHVLPQQNGQERATGSLGTDADLARLNELSADLGIESKAPQAAAKVARLSREARVTNEAIRHNRLRLPDRLWTQRLESIDAGLVHVRRSARERLYGRTDLPAND